MCALPQIEEGKDEELTEYDIKKMEKEKRVEELREKAKELKEREDEVRSKVDEGKAGLEEHKEKLRSIIEACKALYENFDDKRREVGADAAFFPSKKAPSLTFSVRVGQGRKGQEDP